MEYNDMFNDIPQSYFDYILREKRGKMNLEHFINSGYSEWMSESDLVVIELTEDEMVKFANYYYSRFKSESENIVKMTFKLNNDDSLSFETDNFSSLMCDGVDLLETNKFPSTNGQYIVEGKLKKGITVIGGFNQCKILYNIEIPSGVTEIEPSAFNSSNLISITFAEDSQLTRIKNYAFSNCLALKSIKIPSGVTEIESYAFYGCNSLRKIICYATTAPLIQSTTFMYGVEYGTLYYPQGSDYSTWLSKKTNYLGYKNWNSRYISDSNIGSGEIVKMTFNLDGDDSISFNTSTLSSLMCNGIDLLETNKFPSTNGQYIVEGELKENVNYIDNGMFRFCSTLTSIEIPSVVTEIDSHAFYKCSNLTSITCHTAIAPSIQSDYTFNYVASNGILYHPQGSNYSTWLSKLSGWQSVEI